MDSEFPDPDEEFDLIHEDEYELLREIEEIEKEKVVELGKTETLQKSEIIHKNASNTTSNVYKELNNPIPNNTHNDLCISTTGRNIEFRDTPEIDITKKRGYDEIFGDISDILEINDFENSEKPKEKKPRWDEPQDVIKAVLDAREKYHEFSRGVSVKRNHIKDTKESISLRVPRWNFVAVTRPHDAQRIYVRIKDDEKYMFKTNTNLISNLLSVPYSQLKAEAEEIIAENVKHASFETFENPVAKAIENDELWVDKYKPRTYIELLSDESVNRNLLHWIKLWDKVVFNRNYVQSRKGKLQSIFRNKKFKNENSEEVDNKGFPTQRVVLLSGPPGLGKTTLAHLAAKHAGYNVVEINASDERSPDAFRQVLLASTQMKAVMGSDPRPNCLILDEIDGAPAASIDLLLKFVQGKLTVKGKKDKMKTDKQSNVCHRPVICICNEPYTPSLRALRAIALIIPVPEVSPARLAERLMEISHKEHLKVNPDALLKLVEISGCDIRSCLGALQYMGGIRFGDNLSFALKDSRKGLFDSWKQILTIPVNRGGILPISERVRIVLKTVQRGETDKLAQGIFHNYPEICSEKLGYIAICLQWFQFFDEICSLVTHFQTWSVMPYTNYAFVTWHLYFAKARNARLSYPSIFYEVKQKEAKNIGILTSVQRSSGRDNIVLSVDIIPFLPELLSPRLRTISGHLHSSKERDDIVRIVNILIEFGLTYAQERNLDGTYDYKLDPDIFEIGIFPECKHRRTLAYGVKQIIVQELEAERLRRAANVIKNVTNLTQYQDKNGSKQNITEKSVESKVAIKEQNNASSPSNCTEHVNKIEPKTKEIKYKDFFGRIITVDQNKQKKSDNESINSHSFLTKHGVWYKYKEGFSNAVRRTIKMKELF
ncbi:chromosome transmission fidelity protein 18 homolog [Megachile rotundata]|uniref:chromosome transmission fidelity protein 18 homolog n=1 Tax=Megachile rotundata TaxID=143995 RepID=UPI003FD08120